MSNRNRNEEARVFVGNLDYHTTVKDIQKTLSQYGEVVDVYFPKDKGRKPPRLTKRRRNKTEPVSFGCAFVELRDKAQADDLVATMDKVLDPYDRVLYFSRAVPHPKPI